MDNKQAPPEDPILARLDEIALHLQHIDARDKWRMIGSTMRGVVTLSFIVITLWSSIYLLYHLTDIIKMVADQTAQATMNAGKSGSEDMLKKFQDMLKK